MGQCDELPWISGLRCASGVHGVAALTFRVTDSPSQENPIETSYGDDRGVAMSSDETARGNDGLTMYFVVFNSSLCLQLYGFEFSG